MTVPPEKLPEDQFIQNGKIKFPIWIWLFLAILLIGLMSQFIMWYWHGKDAVNQQPPFYRVTNREMSLFYWQHPHFRQLQAPGQIVQTADQSVIVSGELLFRYHTWNRLIRDEFTNTSIPVDDFLKFLTFAQEWQPDNWPDAPKPYRELIPQLPQKSSLNLAELSKGVLPQEVRIAFQGWRNAFIQSQKIENTHPTYEKMKRFIMNKPDYARNYWQNLYPQYLGSTVLKIAELNQNIPDNEIPPFLKQAYFNWQQSQSPLP